MSIFVSYETKPKYPPLEAGSYAARCYGIVVTGTEYSQMFDKLSTGVTILWELPTELVEGTDEHGQPIRHPRALSQSYTLSLSPKSKLRAVLENWRGKAFTDEELRAFDISKLIGAPCLLNVLQDQKGDGTIYNKVMGVARVPKGMNVDELYNKTIEFDIRDTNTPLSAVDALPEWLQKRIKQSDEYMARTNPEAAEAIDDTEDLPW